MADRASFWQYVNRHQSSLRSKLVTHLVRIAIADCSVKCVFGAGSISRVQQYIGGNPCCHEGEGVAAVQMARDAGILWWPWLYGWSNQPSNNQRCRREFFEIYERWTRYHRVLILPPDFPFWQCPYHGDVLVWRCGLYQVILPHSPHAGVLTDGLKIGNA